MEALGVHVSRVHSADGRGQALVDASQSLRSRCPVLGCRRLPGVPLKDHIAEEHSLNEVLASLDRFKDRFLELQTMQSGSSDFTIGFKCPICDVTCDTRSEFRLHLSSRHLECKPPDNEEHTPRLMDEVVANLHPYRFQLLELYPDLVHHAVFRDHGEIVCHDPHTKRQDARKLRIKKLSYFRSEENSGPNSSWSDLIRYGAATDPLPEVDGASAKLPSDTDINIVTSNQESHTASANHGQDSPQHDFETLSHTPESATQMLVERNPFMRRLNEIRKEYKPHRGCSDSEIDTSDHSTYMSDSEDDPASSFLPANLKNAQKGDPTGRQAPQDEGGGSNSSAGGNHTAQRASQGNGGGSGSSGGAGRQSGDFDKDQAKETQPPGKSATMERRSDECSEDSGTVVPCPIPGCPGRDRHICETL